MSKNRNLRILVLLILVAAMAAVVVYLLIPSPAPEAVTSATLAPTLPATPIPASPGAATQELGTPTTTTPAFEQTATNPPSDISPTLLATATVGVEYGLDLGSGLRLITTQTEYQDPPPFTYQFALPRLEGGTPEQAESFNQEVDARVAYEIDSFRAAIPEGETLEGGGFGINYTVPFAAYRLLSVQLEVGVYVLGSAHPSAWTRTINYDLAAGRVLTLADLFQPGTDYLGLLSDHCLADLEKQGVLHWEDGALPTAENYETKWNFSPWGLLITFDEYTVAPYAAGPQSAIVPYEMLQGIAAPNGPLAPFLP